jgi:hypothetical protein
MRVHSSIWLVEYHGKRGLAFRKGGLWHDWVTGFLVPEQTAVHVVPFSQEESM